jgi:hypothetical protein
LGEVLRIWEFECGVVLSYTLIENPITTA